MAENGHVPIFHRANNTLRHVCFRQVENGMDRSDDKVELRQDLVRKIELTVAKNVAFDPGKETKAVERFIKLPNCGHLHAQLRFIQSVRLDRASAVFRDSQILKPKLLRPLG